MDKAKEYHEHINKLLRDRKIPELQGEAAEDPLLSQIHHDLKAIREATHALSVGDFSIDISARGIIPGNIKSFQAHMRHLIWHVKMIEEGDLAQQVYKWGEFTSVFNKMVVGLHQNVSKLQEKEKKLTENEANLKFMASRDPLTGVLNRRAFIELMEDQLERAAEKYVSCCVVLMDLDNFKAFNDTHGHLAGDEALRHVTKIVESGLRKFDFMGRYGGEEFIIFLYDIDEQTGIRIMERLRKQIAESPVVLKDGTAIAVYASFGMVGSLSEDSTSDDYIEKLIHNADVALYAAKKAGRNRVMLYNPELTMTPKNLKECVKF